MKISKILVAAAFSAALISCSPKDTLNLAGKWKVSLDSLSTFQAISLPGTTDGAGLGTPNTLEPALQEPQLTRLTRKHSFLGAAFYKRTINIPKSMADKPLLLTFERVLWQSSVWIDGEQLNGAEESLTTAHRYRLNKGLSAGRHEILVRIDNRKRYDLSWRDLAHAYTNDTQVMWNGILGEMSLKAMGPVEIERIDVYPDYATRSAEVVTILRCHDVDPIDLSLAMQVDKEKETVTKVDMTGNTTVARTYCPLSDDITLWDEFSPALHTMKVRCGGDEKTVSFGVRSFKADGTHIAVNGRRTFLRGTLNCCIYPLTGTPPLDEKGWEKEMKVMKEWGLNHIRFHSWCPPDAAFRVADRLGLYLQVELPDWARTIGEDDTDNFLTSEYNRIIAEYGNHPSFCMLTCGNELDRGYDFLNGFLRYMKSADPRHLYSNSSYSMGTGHKGYPEPEDEFMVASRTYLGQIRGQSYLGVEKPDFTHDYSSVTADFNLPLISHEIGQYSVYPNIAEIDKYTGTLDPLNFKAVRDALEQKGRLDRAADYTMASGRLSAILYKEEVERALKTPRLAGFQLLGLQDFSGQGSALVGLVDAFWDNKGLVSEEWFRQACSPVTPLVRYRKVCWTPDETFSASVEIANYSAADLKKAGIVWTLSNGKKKVASGKFKADIPTGGVTVLDGNIETGLKSVRKPSQLTLSVSIKGTDWKNSWNIWVYPEEEKEHDSIVTSDAMLALAALEEGKTVLLSPDPKRIIGEPGKFVPVFWSPVFFPHEAGTMGVLCDPSNPALKGFPTEMNSDWQWWNLTKQSKAVDLDAYPQLGTIVEAVDNFMKNRRLGYIFEAKVGEGRLVFSAMDLLSDSAKAEPEVRAMLSSLLDYMDSDSFHPSCALTGEQVCSFLSSEDIRPDAKPEIE